jgi:hypothetical protein
MREEFAGQTNNFWFGSFSNNSMTIALLCCHQDENNIFERHYRGMLFFFRRLSGLSLGGWTLGGVKEMGNLMAFCASLELCAKFAHEARASQGKNRPRE